MEELKEYVKIFYNLFTRLRICYNPLSEGLNQLFRFLYQNKLFITYICERNFDKQQYVHMWMYAYFFPQPSCNFVNQNHSLGKETVFVVANFLL